ncbi:MAG: GNAT family N-acetyltransferase [Bacteroidales bacterium]|nr:GNAT family N-acetyltransferase [Bacteroidales bacterium]
MEFRLKRLTPEHEMLPFDCGDEDLNEFCVKDSYFYQKELLAVTYYIENETETVLFFSLINDKLSAVELSKSFWRKVKSSLPHEKHRRDYPAVKIGRLAVSKKFQSSSEHWGSQIIEFIKSWMIEKNKTGCRFITVDAYKQAVPFYQKNDFDFMGKEEKNRFEADKDNPDSDGTYAMYFDLSNLCE